MTNFSNLNKGKTDLCSKNINKQCILTVRSFLLYMNFTVDIYCEKNLRNDFLDY